MPVALLLAVELLPLTSEMRLCSAELNGPPPKAPAGGGGMPRGAALVAAVPLVELVPAAAAVAPAAVAAVLSALAAAPPLPALPGPLACACSASTRFWMKASIASCGVVVLELDEVEERLDDESVAAAEAVVGGAAGRRGSGGTGGGHRARVRQRLHECGEQTAGGRAPALAPGSHRGLVPAADACGLPMHADRVLLLRVPAVDCADAHGEHSDTKRTWEQSSPIRSSGIEHCLAFSEGFFPLRELKCQQSLPCGAAAINAAIAGRPRQSIAASVTFAP